LKVLVTFALENEFAPWRAMHEFRAEKWSEGCVQVSNIFGVEVGVLLTGMGPKRAGAAAAGVIWGHHDSISACISTGLAGALRPEYAVGDVLAARAIYSQAKVSNRMVTCSAPLVTLAVGEGAVVANRFYTGEQVVGTAGEKRALGHDSDAVEMESFEVVHEALAFGIPAIAIRAISDGVDDSLPIDMNRIISADGSVSVPRVIGEVAKKPQSIPGLVRLGRNSRKAAENLAKFLNSYVAALAVNSDALRSKVEANAG
jgi:adenosylhomocysteine nucleosidase